MNFINVLIIATNILMSASSPNAVIQHCQEDCNKKGDNVHSIDTKVAEIGYDGQEKYYFARSEQDENGGRWILDVESGGYNVERLKVLEMAYVGRKVHITYEGDPQKDDDTEIICAEYSE